MWDVILTPIHGHGEHASVLIRRRDDPDSPIIEVIRVPRIQGVEEEKHARVQVRAISIAIRPSLRRLTFLRENRCSSRVR